MLGMFCMIALMLASSFGRVCICLVALTLPARCVESLIITSLCNGIAFCHVCSFCASKRPTDQVFETLDPPRLNAHLSSLMKGLTAKVPNNNQPSNRLATHDHAYKHLFAPLEISYWIV